MSSIYIQYHKTKIGELILGSFENKLCLLDFKYRRMRSTVDNRITKELNTKYLEKDNDVLAETKNAAESVLEAFNGLEARVIVQEFIKEANGADIRALVVDGQVVGAMKRQGKEGEFRSNLHRGGSANIIQLSDEEENAALKAAKSLGLGICGVDMLQSERGPLILEVNSSPGLEGIEAATKKDIANIIIHYII